MLLTIGGSGGRSPGGDTRPPMIDGRRPGCDDDRDLAVPVIEAPELPGRDDATDRG